jgi:AmpE protein
MTLITILIALVIQRFANLAGWLRKSWFETYLGWLRPILIKCDKWSALAIVLAPILVLLGILHFLFTLRLFGLLYLLLSCAILLLCMDARNLKIQLSKYFEHAEKQEAGDAFNAAAEFAGTQHLPHSLPELYRAMTRLILEKSFTQMFTILFWFGIFGIYGAAGYTAIVLLRHTAVKVDGSFGDLANVAAMAQDALEWAPARVLGVSYALIGQFIAGFSYCARNIKLKLQENTRFAVESGLVNLSFDITENASNLQENYAALALVERALIVWLVAIALVTLGMLL